MINDDFSSIRTSSDKKESNDNKSNNESEDKSANGKPAAGNLPWQLILIAVLSFVVFLTCSGMDVWLSFLQTSEFANATTESAIRGTSISLVGLGILLPTIFFIFSYLKITKQGKEDFRLSKINLLIIGLVTYFLTIIAASIGIWMSAEASDVTPASQKDPATYTFIIIIVLAVILPFFYAFFHFREQICLQILKQK